MVIKDINTPSTNKNSKVLELGRLVLYEIIRQLISYG